MDSVFTILELSRPAPDVVYVEGLVGHIYLDQPRDVQRYNKVFDCLSAMALTFDESAELLQKTIIQHKD